MNPKPLRILVACAAVAAGLLCWYLLSMTPEPAPRRPGKIAASEPPGPGKSRAAAASWPEIRTPEFRDRVRDKAQQWLDARRRDAAGLVALWDLTRDDALLDEAAERFPNDLPGALAALRAATRIGLPREDHRPDRAATLKEAVAACGMPVREAALVPITFYTDHDLIRRFLLTNHRLVLAMMDQFKTNGDIEQSQAVGRTGLASLLNLNATGRNGPLIIANEAVNLHYTTSILSHLPDDWRFHPASLTVSEWKAWAENKKEENGRAQLKAPALLDAAPDEVVVEYSRRFLNEGEEKATTWLMEQSATAPQ